MAIFILAFYHGPTFGGQAYSYTVLRMRIKLIQNNL